VWGVRERNRGAVRALNRANPTPRTRLLLEDPVRPSRPAVIGVTALAVALTGGLLTGVPGAEAAAATTVTVESHEIDVHVGPDGGQTCTIVYDLYRPATATSQTPAPAILTTNGFGGSKDDQADLGQAFAERGYVVLSYSGLGFGGSDCKISLDDPDYDGKAAQQLVTYLGGGAAANDGSRIDYVRKDATAHDGTAMASDPRVGMIGGSYGGQVQLAVAGIDPRVDTIVPIITWNDLAYSLAPNNTDIPDPARHGVSYDTPGSEKVGWTSLFFGVGIADGIEFAGTDPTRVVGCPNFIDYACVAKAQMDALGYPTADTIAFARHASVTSYVDRIRIPTLLMQGEDDTLFNLQEAVATYRALQAQGTETKMIWQSWGHSGGGTPAPGELDMRHPEQSYEGQRVIAWFQRYLEDRAVDTGPEFSFFRDWVGYSGIATPAYGTSSSYPVGSTQRLLLSGAGDLVTSKDAVRPGSATYANLAGETPLSYSEVSALQGDPLPDGVTPPYDTPGSFASWTTRPLSAPVVSVGVPRLTVRVSSPVAEQTQQTGPAGKLLLFAKIYDVAPDGSKTLVNRLVSPTRVADVTAPIQLELPGVVHRYAAGHRLSLVLAATDAAYRNNKVVTPVTVLTSPTAPGVLQLPVLGSPVR
jgi:ABC-2 type transport system ATP-binding protein